MTETGGSQAVTTAPGTAVIERLEDWLSPVRRFLFWVGFFYVLLLAYFPAMKGDFIYDDLPSIVQNSDFREANPIPHILGDHKGALQFDRRPVGGFLTYINFKLFGLSPLHFHAVNLLLHLATAMALGELLILAIRRLGIGHARIFALVCAAFWALHPLNSVSVIFIYQRMEVLMALFFLLSLISLYRSAPPGVQGGFSRWHAVCITSALLSILSKENGAVILFAIPVVDRLLLAGSWKELWERRKLFYIVLGVSWSIVMVWIFGGERVAEMGAGEELSSPWNYFKLQCRVIVGYIGLFFWPDRLTFVYAPRYVATFSEWLPQALLLVLLVGVIATVSRKFLWVAVPGFLFFVSLAPTSSIVPVPLEPQAEWRMYLPSAFLIILCVAALARLARGLDLGHRIPVVAVTLLLFALGLRTNYRSRDFRSPIAIWEDTALKEPLCYKAWANLGYSLLHVKNSKMAKNAGQALLNNADTFGDPYSKVSGHHILGLAALEEIDYKSAKSHLEQAMEVDDAWDGLNVALARALIGLKEYEAALVPLRRQIQHKSDDLTPFAPYAEALFYLGDSDSANEALQKVEAVVPNSAEVSRVRALMAAATADSVPAPTAQQPQ